MSCAPAEDVLKKNSMSATLDAQLHVDISCTGLILFFFYFASVSQQEASGFKPHSQLGISVKFDCSPCAGFSGCSNVG